MRKRVVLIEDYQIVLDSFTKIINNTEDFIVVGGFNTCEDALLKIQEIKPDFVLIDISLPGMNGIEGIKRIKGLLPSVSIIVVTVHENSRYVFDALCMGAVGYVTKSSGGEKLIEALYQVEAGGAPMSINIARMVVESFQKKQFYNLTDKENSVLDLLSEGKTYASIAEDLNVSVNTIKFHVRNIYEKLHVSNKDELINLIKNKSND
ncbi:response regulator transcription factor [Tenacibaculum caenipelagi]|uniref:LuxR family two component transcriptional regulator n=1 Tax=Tenacibaculum caenipelagi TaxID=1325435 RepID=A0A4R6TBH8_9FLAO|nr:response regulator transcription factor [Tenacibaculum caenipelagi]TDQ24028.1 LuxR family two component transcriptional regulator [Tenacibaculum caenipelagi]